MKRASYVLAAVIMTIVVFAACGTKGQRRVSTDGSTSMERVIGFLSEAYMEKNSDIKVTYNPTGSGAGIQAVKEDRCNIGLSSRELKAEEKLYLDSTVVAIDGIAIIVNQQNPIEDLTVEQIKMIYSGKAKSWSRVGGKNNSIVLIGREAASGTREGFETITDTKGKCQYTQELASAGDVIQAVSGNPNAIGYTSLASVKSNVKTIRVGGVMPSKATIQSGAYKIQRSFLLVTSREKPMSDETRLFFDFATSEDADKYIEMAGAIVPIRQDMDYE